MYSHIVLGGTFDHLHAGHKKMLMMALNLGSRVTIGLTKASMNKGKILAEQIQSYAIRKHALTTFFQSHHRAQDVRIIPITTVFGSTLTDTTLDSILITEQSRKGADTINEHRHQKGLPSLAIEVCPLHLDETSQPISSSAIRLGTINREGRYYLPHFKHDQWLSDAAKTYFKRPFGRAYGARKLARMDGMKIVVGDLVTKYCIDSNISFTTAFIDKKTKRKSFSFDIPESFHLSEIKITNTAGGISAQAAHYLFNQALHNSNTIVEVDGEEDLLTVAAVTLLPFGTEVVYGYPYEPETLRSIRITERIKELFFKQLV